MKLPALALVFSVAAMLHAPARAQQAAQALDAFHAALAAGDKARVLDLLAPQVAIYEAGHVERSRAEYAESHMAADMAFASAAKRKVLGRQVRESASLATVWSETETEGNLGGRPVHLLGVETAVLEKTGDAWRIVHIHWSSKKVY